LAGSTAQNQHRSELDGRAEAAGAYEMILAQGSKLGPYELLSPIGADRMGGGKAALPTSNPA